MDELVTKILNTQLPKLGEKLVGRTLTGVTDVDLLILEKLEDTDLFSICQTDKYANQLCKNEHFWRNRFLKTYGRHTKNSIDKSWKNNYLQSIIDLDQVKKAMIKQIISHLTIGRVDDDLEPFTDDEIDIFISQKKEDLEKAVMEMYETYRNDDDLEDLRNAELDWYKEYLYNVLGEMLHLE